MPGERDDGGVARRPHQAGRRGDGRRREPRSRSSSPTGRPPGTSPSPGGPTRAPGARRAPADVPRRGRRRSPPSRRPGRARHRRRRAPAAAAPMPRRRIAPVRTRSRISRGARARTSFLSCSSVAVRHGDQQGERVVGVLGQGALHGLEVELADLGRQLGELRVPAQLGRARSSGRRAAATSARDRSRGSRPPQGAGSAFPRRPLGLRQSGRASVPKTFSYSSVTTSSGVRLLDSCRRIRPDSAALARRQPDLPVRDGHAAQAGELDGQADPVDRTAHRRADADVGVLAGVAAPGATTRSRHSGSGSGLRVATICCSASSDW